MKITCLNRPNGEILNKESALKLYDCETVKFVIIQLKGGEEEIVCGLEYSQGKEWYHKDYVPEGAEVYGGAQMNIRGGELELLRSSTKYGPVRPGHRQQVLETFGDYFGLPIKSNRLD